jgi:hypothetical protein
MGLTIAQMQLSPFARRGAEIMLAKHPGLVFTSGRRDVFDQARAMAQNVLRDRAWLIKTYKPGPVLSTLQACVLDHPEATTVPAMADHFYEAMLAFDTEVLMRFSRHFTGDAWDAQWPGDEAAKAICADVLSLPHLDKLLTREGKLKLIHAQFEPSVEV